MRAIAQFGAGSQLSTGGRPNRLAPTASEHFRDRRHLTVLFSDLVGSTELSQRLDPEELSQLIDWYHRICDRIMERFGGHVARYVGDGVLTYFGWPQANEDDAERSIRAGLELVAAISAGRAADDRPFSPELLP